MDRVTLSAVAGILTVDASLPRKRFDKCKVEHRTRGVRTRWIAAALSIAAILTMASVAQAQPTNGDGDIYVNPTASAAGPLPNVCSLVGAINQATTGQLDPGCHKDGQDYGGGPGGYTEIDIPGNAIYFTGSLPPLVIQNTEVDIVNYSSAFSTIAGDSYLSSNLFTVGSGGILYLSAVKVLGFTDQALTVNAGGILQLEGTEVSGNNGNNNGNDRTTAAIVNHGGAVQIRDSLIRGNNLSAGSRGGGVYCNDAGQVDISNSTITGNHADEYGGGIFNFGCRISLFEATVGENLQNGTTSGLGGGGIYQTGSASTMDIQWSTIYLNSARAGGPTPGGGIANFGGTITMKNSIVAGNVASDDCTGAIVSGGYNLLGNCTVTGNPPARPNFFSGLNPNLNALDTYAGPVPLYYRPKSNSLAFNGIPAADPDCQAMSGGLSACNIGAYQQP